MERGRQAALTTLAFRNFLRLKSGLARSGLRAPANSLGNPPGECFLRLFFCYEGSGWETRRSARGSSRNVRHKQALGHPLLEVRDHRLPSRGLKSAAGSVDDEGEKKRKHMAAGTKKSRRIAGPDRATKASEMAAREVDRISDPSATEEERQLRKGPKEFRDIRKKSREDRRS